jgi:hypothetical protein
MLAFKFVLKNQIFLFARTLSHWSLSVNGVIYEIIPHNTPEPLGNYTTLTHYVDANLMHDLLTGRSVTSIPHMANKTPIDRFSKKQKQLCTVQNLSQHVFGLNISLTFVTLSVIL